MTITPDQCRAGRALLGWDIRSLAKEAGIGINTVSRFENHEDVMTSSVNKIRAALEGGGVEFIPRNGGGEGVRKRK